MVFTVLGLIALFSPLCSSAAVAGSCPDGSQPVQCFVSPCLTVLCAEGHECVANYCGGCNFDCVPVCKEGDKTYHVGESYEAADGCNTCSCTSTGLSICTKKFCIAPTCEYNDQEYSVGDSFGSTDGCNTCECSDGGLVSCTEMTCCPVFRCMACESGYLKDENDCDTCQCKDPCERVQCAAGETCNNGVCKTSCPVFRCMACESGYLKDEKGCDTCQCKDPCERVQCAPGETCNKGVCKTSCRNNLPYIACFADPCSFKKCRKNKVCQVNNCGGCTARCVKP